MNTRALLVLVALLAPALASTLVPVYRTRGDVARITRSYDARIYRLERACVPADTGGGVEQCEQTSRADDAVLACVANPAYTRALIPQCLVDYREQTR